MMKKNVIKMMILCLTFFALLSTSMVAQEQDGSPQAEGTTVPSIDINVKKKPGGRIVAVTATDSNGNFSFLLLPGDYTIEIGGARPIGLPRETQQAIEMVISQITGYNTRNTEDKTATFEEAESINWISVPGGLYEFYLVGEDLTVGRASLLEDNSGVTGVRVFSRKVVSAIQAEFAIKDKGINRVVAVPVTGKTINKSRSNL